MQNNELEKKSNRLLSCPFCGGEAFVDTHKFWDEKAKDFTVQTYGVACHQCGSKSWQHCRTEEDAIKHWNTRKPMERIVEQLEEMSLSYELNCYKMIRENKCHESEDCGMCAFKQAIEIVKGGVDNG